MNERVRVQVLSSFADTPGTLVVDEDEIVEKEIVSGIAYSRDEAKLTVRHVPDRPGIAATMFGALAQAENVNVDMIVQNISADGMTDMTFTVGKRRPAARAGDLEGYLGRSSADALYEIVVDPEVTKISVVGVGMRSHAGVANTMFRTLADKGDQHPGHLDQRDQDQRADRGRIHRARDPRPAHRLRPRCRLTSARR